MQPNTITRWNPWPVSIVAFFAVAIAGLTLFIVFCNRHPADLVASDYYEQEVRYQAHLDQVQRTPSAASVSYDAQAQAITIQLPRAAIGELRGSIQLYRPNDVALDRTFALRPDQNGLQQIDAASLQPGLWKVRVSWRATNEDFFFDQKLVVGRKAS